MTRSRASSRKRLIGVLLAGAMVAAAGCLVMLYHVRSRNSYVRELLCPFCTGSEWNEMLKSHSVVIEGDQARGTVWLYADVGGHSSWWVYKYERIDSWPSSTAIPARLLDGTSIVAAAELTVLARGSQWRRELVVADAGQTADSVRGVLKQAGWDLVPTETRALFGWDDRLLGMVPGDHLSAEYEGIAFEGQGGGGTRLWWSRVDRLADATP